MSAEKPIALIHGYGLQSKREKPDIRGNAQVRAAELLYRSGQIEAVALAGGQIYPDRPSLSDVTAGQLRRRGVIPEDKIFVLYTQYMEGLTTRDEIRLFKEAATKQGWTHLADVSNETHQRRIRRAYRRAFGERAKAIVTISTEDTLSTYGPPRYKIFVEKARISSDERAFKRQEAVLNLIDAIPFVGGVLLDIIAHNMGNKGDIQTRVLKLLQR